MSKKGGTTQTVNTGIDAASQAYVNRMRQAARAGTASLPTGSQDPLALAKGFMNPYQDSVVSALNAAYDRSRSGASVAARQDAAASGAFGDSRAAQTEGARLGAIDRAQAEDVANLNYQGFNNALQYGVGQQQYLDQLPYTQLMQRLQAYNLGLGPTGSTQTTETQKHGGWGDALQGIAGLGLTLASGGAAAPALLAGGGAGAVSSGKVPSLFDNVRLGQWGGIG